MLSRSPDVIHVQWSFRRESKSTVILDIRARAASRGLLQGPVIIRLGKCIRFQKLKDANVKQSTTIKMRWFFSLLLLGLLAAVNALSSSGSRLLVVLEELGEKERYSKFLSDLEGERS